MPGSQLWNHRTDGAVPDARIARTFAYRGGGAAIALERGTAVLSGATRLPPPAPRLGQDAAIEGGASGVTITADVRAALAGAAVADRLQSAAPHPRACASLCRSSRVPLLIGTTGFDAASRAPARGSRENRSCADSAEYQHRRDRYGAFDRGSQPRPWGPTYDVEISEADDHRMKRDAPSGTALALGGGRGRSARAVCSQTSPSSTGTPISIPRKPGSIGFAVSEPGTSS